ncbi:hydroxycinnamic acid degradation regulator [Marinicauda pacifica]|nr:MarR family transcriptional regulator [Marinicauda pacifica]GGE37680.1 hydroxycinnamic acid degradation regulator [Marinicauda pacifica]
MQAPLRDPLKNFVGYALRRASSLEMANLSNQLAQLDLRPTEGSVIVIVQANPGIRQSDIGRMLDIASANMTPLIARLDSRGLILRKRKDGRSQGLRLTEEGMRLATQALAEMEKHEREMMARVPEAMREPLVSALQSIWREQPE